MSSFIKTCDLVYVLLIFIFVVVHQLCISFEEEERHQFTLRAYMVFEKFPIFNSK